MGDPGGGGEPVGVVDEPDGGVDEPDGGGDEPLGDVGESVAVGPVVVGESVVVVVVVVVAGTEVVDVVTAADVVEVVTGALVVVVVVTGTTAASTIVPVARDRFGSRVAPVGSVSTSENVSGPSATSSWATGTSTLLVISPDANTTSPDVEV